MLTFKELREKKNIGMPAGQHVFDTKVKGIQVMVHKQKNMFVTYVDGDKLDSFKDEKSAKKAGLEFVKTYKG